MNIDSREMYMETEEAIQEAQVHLEALGIGAPLPPGKSVMITFQTRDCPPSSEYGDGSLCVDVQFSDYKEEIFTIEIPYQECLSLSREELGGRVRSEAILIARNHADHMRSKNPSPGVP